jgi:uncharacterized protein YndB with AHSA1/START domain
MSNESKDRRGPRTTVERTYRARIEDVWELWTTKEGFESWWGPQGFRAEVHALEARAGGELRYDMIADTPEMIEAMREMGRPPSHPTHSRFTEVKRHQRLVVTNVIDFLPGVAPYEADIEVDFSVAGDSVRMVVTFEALHSEELSRMQQEGFTSQLTKLDQRFA